MMLGKNLQVALTALVAGGIALAAVDAKAALKNRYSFTTDATDSIGGQNGTLFGTNGSFADGQLVLANTGEGSGDPGAAGAYLDLPNGLISSAASSGTPGQMSVEIWLTVTTNRNWAAAFTAGTSSGGEDVSSGGNEDAPYIQLIPQTGALGNDVRFTTNAFPGVDGDGAESFVDDADTFEAGVLTEVDGTALTVGRREHILGVFNQPASPSVGNMGTFDVYRNGTLLGSRPIADNLNIQNFRPDGVTEGVGDVNVWLGRSQWPDSLLAGNIDEFRVYDTAETANTALVNTVFGPDVIGATAIPSIEVDTTTGEITFKNNANAPVNLEYYSIASAAGGLSTSGWDSFDDQNYNAVDGPDGGSTAGDSVGEGWDQAGGSSANLLTEAFLGEAGSILAPNASISLGSAFDASVFGGAAGDLVFNFGVTNGGLIDAPVTYVTGDMLTGDYNLDGIVNAADYTVWRDTFGDDVAAGTGADGNNDGTITDLDYDVWSGNYGATTSSTTSAVPEPGTIGLALLTLLGFTSATRTRK